MKRFQDETHNIAYRPADDGYSAHRHHSKKQKRDKGLEIVFDPKVHKEYVTGFRKRKQQRRKEALVKLEKRGRQQRLDERAERRQAFKDQLDLPASNSDDDNISDDEDDVKRKVHVFNSGNLTSTVTVAPIGGDTDDDELVGGSDSEDDDNEDGGEKKVKEQKHHISSSGCKVKDKKKKVYPEAPTAAGGSGGSHKKLTKGAVKAMRNTKLKLEGKKVPKKGSFKANKPASTKGTHQGRSRNDFRRG